MYLAVSLPTGPTTMTAFLRAAAVLVWAFARNAFRAPVPGRIGGGA